MYKVKSIFLQCGSFKDKGRAPSLCACLGNSPPKNKIINYNVNLLYKDQLTALGPKPVYSSPQRPGPYGKHEPVRKPNTSINYVCPVLNCFGLHTSWCCTGMGAYRYLCVTVINCRY